MVTSAFTCGQGAGDRTGSSARSGLPTTTRVQITGPASVSVAVFDGRGRVWLRHPSANVLEITARGRVARGETAAETAYRLEREAFGFSIPIDDADHWNPRADHHEADVFIGFTNLEVPEDQEFVAWPVTAVLRMLEVGSEFFGPVVSEALGRACRAFRARHAELLGSVARHPAAQAPRASQVWKPRPRTLPLSAPHTVDLRLLGTCQLRCEWCWGPEHFRRGTVSGSLWAATLEALAERGTRQVTISGGEPTKSPALRQTVQAARRGGMSVTLSTNGILLPEFTDVVEVIYDVGIPVDGSTPLMNDRMRKGSLRFQGWEKAIAAIGLVQKMRRAGVSNAMVTVRVVVARPNLHDVPTIPNALDAAGVDLSPLRIKLYQVEPFGPHFGQTDFERDWAITSDEACACAAATRARAPQAHIELQLYTNTVGRYFLIDPDSGATGTDEDHAGQPVEVPYGNVVYEFERTLAHYREHQRSVESREQSVQLPRGGCASAAALSDRRTGS